MSDEIHKRSELVEDKPRITIGTIGHVGHGKTMLTAAILKALDQVEKAERMRTDNHRGIEL